EAMALAIGIAAGARTTASPNPWVGAAVIADGEVIALGATEAPGGRHAEIVALDSAGSRAQDSTLVVTLEPCAMCCGAMAHARLARVVYGAAEPKTGAVTSVTRLFELPGMHAPSVTGGVMAEACGELIQS
ncbi:MAG: deaminase, partial [Actinobacteria bacterium]|nr:deaminase [Actinomycetota bacterium]